MHFANCKKTTYTFVSNIEHIASHHIRKAFVTARNKLLLLDGEQTSLRNNLKINYAENS
jgi:hypothetical protein